MYLSNGEEFSGSEIGEWHYILLQTGQLHYATTSFLIPPGSGSTPRAS